MRARLTGDRGEISLASLLVGTVVMLVISASILVSFETWLRVDVATVAKAETQDRARRSLGQLSRELRNLASPRPEQPESVDLVSAYDIVFQTVDPVGPNAGANATNVRRVRYCLDGTIPGKLWLQTQRWTTAAVPAMPSTAACPGTGWTSSTIAAERVLNRKPPVRPLFLANSATNSQVSALHVDLVVDDKEADAVPGVTLSTGVFLRNQNRRPTAAFTATRTASGIVLNGSGSSDPEGETLTYEWFDGPTKVGEGVTFTYGVSPGTARTMGLTVKDPAGLPGTAPTQVVP